MFRSEAHYSESIQRPVLSDSRMNDSYEPVQVNQIHTARQVAIHFQMNNSYESVLFSEPNPYSATDALRFPTEQPL